MSSPASDTPTPDATIPASSASASAPLSKAQKQAAKQAALIARSQALLPATAPWTIAVAKSCGRRGVATAPIAAGTTLVDEQAAGWIIRAEMAKEWCAQCFKPIAQATAKTCAGKCSHVYCSNECAADAAPLHQFVCPLLPSLPVIARLCSVEQDMLALVVTLIAGMALEQQQRSGEAATTDASASAAASASSSGSASEVTRWQAAADLVSHMDRAVPAWVSVIEQAMKLLIERYRTLQAAPDSIFAGLRVPDVQTLVNLCARINSNAHALFDNYSSSNSTIGLGLFPLTSILNHSCSPNAAFSPASGGRMIVRALRDIAAGEEICVHYVDLLQSRSERQRELLTDKYFSCACQRCRMEEKSEKLSFPFPVGGEAALSARTVEPVAVPSGTQASVECPVSSAQLWSWLLLGAVQCPACKKPAAAPASAAAATAAGLESDAWLDEDENKKNKKKTKKKTVLAAAAPAAASSSSAAASADCPAVSGSTLDIVAARSQRESTYGLLVWRGSPEELRTKVPAPSAPDSAASALPPQPKSWHCTRHASHRFTGAEAEVGLSGLPPVFRRIATLRSSGQDAEALQLYEAMLSKIAFEIATPGHALMLSLQVNLFNVARALGMRSGASAASSASAGLGRSVAAGFAVLAMMEDTTPEGSVSLEQSDFCVAVASTMLEAIEPASKAGAAAAAAADRQSKLQQVRQLFQRAYDLRAIGCGVHHPRTVSTVVPAAWASEVSIRRRESESGEGWPITLPRHWQQTAVGPQHESAVAASLATSLHSNKAS